MFLYYILTLCTLSGPMDPNAKIYVTEDFFILIFEMSVNV